MRKQQIALLLLKQAGLAGDAAHTLLAAGKGVLTSGQHVSDVMRQAGVRSPLAHAAVKAAPYAGAAYGAKKAYESEPVQQLRYKLQMRKQRKLQEALAEAQGGY